MQKPTGIRDKNGVMIFYEDTIIYGRRKFIVKETPGHPPAAIRDDRKHMRLLERIADSCVVRSDNVKKMVFKKITK